MGDNNLVLNYKFLVFPTYVPEYHFSAIAVENNFNDSYTICNFDSLPPSKHNKKTVEFAKLKLVEMFLSRLHLEQFPKSTVSFKINNFQKQTQFNGYDCGVFVCMKAMDYFNKKTEIILDQVDTNDFRKMMFGMLINDFIEEYEKIENEAIMSVILLNEDEINLLGDLKNMRSKANINTEAIIALTTEKVSSDDKKVNNINHLQTAIESFITIEIVRTNLKELNNENFTNLCCKEFMDMYNRKPPTQNFWEFLKEIFEKLTKEIEYCFDSERVFKLLNKTYVERSSNINLFESKGFVEKQYVHVQNSFDVDTQMCIEKQTSPTKQVLDFPKSIYENPLSLLSEIESKYTATTDVVETMQDKIAGSLLFNTFETKNFPQFSPEDMKEFNLSAKQKAIKRKVYLMSFRLFESIAVQYLEDKKVCDIDTTRCKNILKGYSRLNPKEIDYFSSFVMAAYEQISCDPNQNEYIKVLLHLVTNKKEEAGVKVEKFLSITDLINEVKDVSLDDMVEE